MTRIIGVAVVVGALVAGLGAAQETDKEQKIKMKDLPAAVQQAIKEQSKGTVARGLSTEMDNGQRVYEAEIKVDGHSRDITFDANGHIVSVEEETTLEKIPAAARLAIQKAAGKGKIGEVETVTAGGVTAYEAQLKIDGKKSEVKVDASGKAVK